MSKVYWVRHGPTHEKVFTGWRDVPADLSDTAQLARLEAYLPDDGVVISSDLQRAVTTANAIMAKRERLPPDPALREFDFGVWDGMHFSDVAERDPELSRAFWETPGDVAPPEGESWNQVATRIDTAVRKTLAQIADRPLIAVAHFGAILTHLNVAGGLSPTQAMSHRIDNLSVTEIAVAAPSWRVERINHCP